MKKTLLLSAALMALLAGPALAQRGDRNDDRGGNRGGERPAAAAPAPAAPAPAAPAPQVQRGSMAPQGQQAPAPQALRPPVNRGDVGRYNNDRANLNRGNAPVTSGRNDNNQPGFNRGNAPVTSGRNGNNQPGFNRGNDNRGGNNFGRNDNNQPGFNRGNDNRGGFNNNFNNRPGNNGYRGNARPNYSQYNRAFNAPQRFRFQGSYQRPYGWYARRWSYGDFLPSLFWSSNYWIDDFDYYDLMPPPPGTVWVRDGSDALLIDRYTGEVIQVEYNIFY